MDQSLVNQTSNGQHSGPNSTVMGLFHNFQQMIHTNYHRNQWRESGTQILNEFQQNWAAWSPPPPPDPSTCNLRKRQRPETQEKTPKRRKLLTGFHSYRPTSSDQLFPVPGIGSRTPKPKEIRATLFARNTKQQHKRKLPNSSNNLSFSALKPRPLSIRKVRKDIQTSFVGDEPRIVEQVQFDAEIELLVLDLTHKIDIVHDEDAMEIDMPFKGYLVLALPQNCSIDTMWPMFVFGPINEIRDSFDRKLSL